MPNIEFNHYNVSLGLLSVMKHVYLTGTIYNI